MTPIDIGGKVIRITKKPAKGKWHQYRPCFICPDLHAPLDFNCFELPCLLVPWPRQSFRHPAGIVPVAHSGEAVVAVG